MTGLLFLGACLLWLGLTVYLTIKVPGWLGLKSTTGWLLRLLLVPLLLVGPFVDEIVGMGQFERLCAERTAISVSSDATKVRKATDQTSDAVPIPGYLINIKMSKRTYIDVETNKPFLSYDIFRTRGGRVMGLALLGGWHSCSAENVENKNHRQFAELKAYDLLRNGRNK